MSKSNVNGSSVLLGALFTVLFVFSGITSCSGGGGSTTTNTNTPSGPSISVSATPSMIAYNGTSVISWSTSSDATSCTSSPSGVNGTTGSFTTPPLTAITTYTLTCIDPIGSSSKSVTVAVGLTAIVSVQASWAATPLPDTASGMTGAVHYFCDCGTGASGSCVTGSDSNNGLSASTPKQTIASAITTLRSAPRGDTVALCKGGAFNAASMLSINSSSCPSGTICNDLREYTPTTFAGTAKPIINSSGSSNLMEFSSSAGGYRLLNLKLQGTGAGWGLFFYNGPHDITMGNLDIDAFSIAIYNAGGNQGVTTTTNIKLSGNTITNSRTMGFLGGGINAEINYNYWDNNGGSNSLDHTIYLSAWLPGAGATNMSLIGNYIHGQWGSSCLGGQITAHGGFTNLNILNNTVLVDQSAATATCWGISLSAPGGAEPTYFRNTTVSGNTLKNTGSLGININECPGCIVENNLIMMDWNLGYATAGIYSGWQAHRSGLDDTNTANVIRNNTIWTGASQVNGVIGVQVSTEGTGYVVANNTVTYSASASGPSGVSCFNYSLALSAYSFINNNHCYSTPATYSWVAGHGTLSNWVATNGQGFDSASKIGGTPFTVAGTDFTPAPGSPLLNAGDTAHGSATDITGKARLSPPAIGAYEP